MRTERTLKSQDSDCLRFDSNDYFNLRQDKRVIAAAIKALETHGAGAGASRLAGGNYPWIEQAEQQLADHYGYPACLIFGSGYMANIAMITALCSEGDLILADKYAHACMIDGARLSGAKLIRFRHNNADHARMLLQKYRGLFRRCMIVTETIFSMDGDSACIAELSTLATEHNALLYADHAHGPGFYTPNPQHIHLLSGTLSKAFGSYGGYVCMSQEVKHHVINTARPFIFSTAPPPASIAAAMAAVRIIASEPERIRHVISMRDDLLDACGYTPHVSLAGAIIPYIIGDNERTTQLSVHLEQHHAIAVPAIRPPTVPAGTARLRIVIQSGHQQGDILRLADVCRHHHVNTSYPV